MTYSNYIRQKKKFVITFPSFTYNLLIAAIFTILKLMDVIDWNWIWVLNSLWLPYLLMLSIFSFFFILSTIGLFIFFKKCGIKVKTYIKKLK